MSEDTWHFYGYVKDPDTGAIINNNEEEYKKFIAARESSKKSRDLSIRLTEVENELRNMKSMLQQLAHRNN